MEHTLPDWVLEIVRHPEVVRQTSTAGSHVIPLPAKRSEIHLYRPTPTCNFRSVGWWKDGACTHFDFVQDPNH